MSRKSYSVPLDPSVIPLLYMSTTPTFYGLINPNFSPSGHLKATAILCSLLVCIGCGVNYLTLTANEPNPSSVRASHTASFTRREMGYGWYTLRVALLSLSYGVGLGAIFYLAVKALGMNNNLPHLQDIAISVLLAAGIMTVGIILQSLALDFYYRRQERANSR